MKIPTTTSRPRFYDHDGKYTKSATHIIIDINNELTDAAFSTPRFSEKAKLARKLLEAIAAYPDEPHRSSTLLIVLNILVTALGLSEFPKLLNAIYLLVKEDPTIEYDDKGNVLY